MENKLILHRGYKGKYPENSKSSFINALKDNLPFEIDIRISKDNIPFIIHDDSLERLFGAAGRIKFHDSGYLTQFSYLQDSAQKLFSLEEFCKLLGKKYPDIYVHIKKVEDVYGTINVFKKFFLTNKIKFFACDNLTMDLIQIIKDEYPEFKVGLHFFENSPYFDSEYFKLADFIWADEITIPWIDKEKVKLAHILNKQFIAISPELIPESIFNENIEKRWKELIYAGVDGICTDLPDRFRRFGV